MKIKILVVDDETPICEWLIYCIHRASPDYEVISASNGEEAWALIRERKPEVVFTDIRMPGMDGLELMRKVLEVLPFTLFAILTNYAEFSYAKQALSLGAKEYFLKSEMRGADIEKLLNGVVERKQRLLANKVEDTLPSGCIDLYNFYQAQEQAGYANRFWLKQGMEEARAFVVLCIPNDGTPKNWEPLTALAEELRSRDSRLYVAVATEREYLYLVLQHPDGRDLGGRPESIATAMRERTGRDVGVSRQAELLDEFPRLAKEAAKAADARFFGGRGIIWYEILAGRPTLDRESIRQGHRDILAHMAGHRYDQAIEAVKNWYHHFERTGAEDLAWAVDNCRRTVLAVEERFYQQTDSPSQQMEIQNSLFECRDRCLELLGKMKSLYSGKCSPSIETALRYIREHYAQPISMAEVAKEVYRSPEYFSRQFKEEVGENFSVYLTLYRLDRAQELLQHTDARVTEIAERVGYTTPGYFSRLYKKYKGIAPERERRSNL